MKAAYECGGVVVYHGDALATLTGLEADSIDCCVTSPPYWRLRDYGFEGQIGLEATPEEFVDRLVGVFSEVRRVLKPTGTCWVNMGDSYNNCNKWGGGGANTGKHTRDASGDVPSWKAVRRKRASVDGIKPKDLCLVPFRLALALQASGWWVRSVVIWHKPNPMPESVQDRPTTAHEYVFLLTKSERYFYDADAIKETAKCPDGPNSPKGRYESVPIKGGTPFRTMTGGPGGAGKRGSANVRSVWTIATQPYPEAHFATFPEELPRRCIKAGCPEGGMVLDPFAGSGRTLQVAKTLGRRAIGIEGCAEYLPLINRGLPEGVQGSLPL